MKRYLSIIALLALFGGCGGGSDDNSEETPETSESPCLSATESCDDSDADDTTAGDEDVSPPSTDEVATTDGDLDDDQADEVANNADTTTLDEPPVEVPSNTASRYDFLLNYTAEHLHYLTSTEETIFEGYYYLYQNTCNIATDGMIFVASDTDKSIGGVFLYNGTSLRETIYGWFTNDIVTVDVSMLTPVDEDYYISTLFSYSSWSGLRFVGVYFTSMPSYSEICHISYYHY